MPPLKQNATASTKAIVLQLCVAVQKCYEMGVGESVYIENFGDVSIDNCVQIEVKSYSDKLTDSHKNIWNTIRNWMSDDFAHEYYSALILLTTQPYGERSRIRHFNTQTTDQRVKTLETIHSENEQRHLERISKEKKAVSPSNVLEYQREILAPGKRNKLVEILGKITIEANSPDLPKLYNEIKYKHLKGILQGKRNDFLNSLIGYVTQPQASNEESWVITYDDFDSKVGDLTSRYCRETRTFPSKYYRDNNAPNGEDTAEFQDYLFVRKIGDIEYKEIINEAIIDYLKSIKTINEEFGTYLVPPRRTKQYSNELRNIFRGKYRRALRNCRKIVTESQDLFDEITNAESHEFEGFITRPPRKFRNGVLHLLMNDTDDTLKWRLEEDD